MENNDISLNKVNSTANKVPLQKLSFQQIQYNLNSLSHWQLTPNARKIAKTFIAKDFRAGIELINRVADIAENMVHHPDLQLISYRNVRIEIFTHAVDGLTEADFELARAIDNIQSKIN